MTRRAKMLVVIGCFAFVCLVVGAFYQKEIRVGYHLNRMWAARENSELFSRANRTTTKLEGLKILMFRMSGHKESGKMLLHENALLKLGHFEKRDFIFTNRVFQSDSDWPVLLSQITNTFDGNHWWTCWSPVSNGLGIIATPADMPKWERLISDFDR